MESTHKEGHRTRPSITSLTHNAFLSAFSDEEFFGMETNVRFILEYALEAEDVRGCLAFPCMLGPITGVERPLLRRDRLRSPKSLQASGSMSVDESGGGWVGGWHVVRSDAYESPYETRERGSDRTETIMGLWGKWTDGIVCVVRGRRRTCDP